MNVLKLMLLKFYGMLQFSHKKLTRLLRNVEILSSGARQNLQLREARVRAPEISGKLKSQ